MHTTFCIVFTLQSPYYRPINVYQGIHGVMFGFFYSVWIIHFVPEKNYVRPHSIIIGPIFWYCRTYSLYLRLISENDWNSKTKMLLDSFFERTDDSICLFFTFEKEIPRIDIRRYILKTEFFTEFFQFFHVDFFISADIDTSEQCDIFHKIYDIRCQRKTRQHCTFCRKSTKTV